MHICSLQWYPQTWVGETEYTVEMRESLPPPPRIYTVIGGEQSSSTLKILRSTVSGGGEE